MNQVVLSGLLKDWSFNYNHVYRVRRTNKEKEKFLSVLTTDIVEMREDISIIEYKKDKKYVSTNVYVGNVEKAETIICTYFDTPPKTIGSYELFNRKQQSNSVLMYLLMSMLISLVVGILLTLFFINTTNEAFSLKSPTTLIAILCYGAYFYCFNKVVKGLSNKKNFVRNNSSILTLLALISEIKSKKVAFAFVDEGCFGDFGLNIIQKSAKPSANIYFLDSVGADTDLNYIENKGVNYIIGSRALLEDNNTKKYYLNKSDLNKKEFNQKNILEIIKFFENKGG